MSSQQDDSEVEKMVKMNSEQRKRFMQLVEDWKANGFSPLEAVSMAQGQVLRGDSQ